VTSESKLPLGQALSTLFLSKQVMWDVRWGGVFIAKVDRLDALPKDLLPAPTEDAPAPELKLRETLGTKQISFRLRKSTIGSAMNLLGRKGGMKIRLGSTLTSEVKKARFDLWVKDIRLDHALAAILFPRGLRAVVDEAGLRIEPAQGE
jgi:hypothetical protein